MEDTYLPATQQNLCKIVEKISTPATLEMIKTELSDCNSDIDKVEWLMNCFFYFEQAYIIVKINKTGTWGLILNQLDASGDNKEYLDLLNESIIRDWHE